MYNVQSMEFFLYFCAHRHRLARTERQISIDFESTQKWSSLPFIVSVIFLRMAASREAVNFRIAYRISSAESLIDTLLTQQIKGIQLSMPMDSEAILRANTSKLENLSPPHRDR